jgi:hypothetical protein
MTQPKWNDKDENGGYIYFYMYHEVHDHGKTEEDAVAILTKYFGSEPKIQEYTPPEKRWWNIVK